MRNDSETNIVAIHIAESHVQKLQKSLREAENNFGAQSGEAGLALIALVDYLQTHPGNEETINRLSERIEEIVEIYRDACE